MSDVLRMRRPASDKLLSRRRSACAKLWMMRYGAVVNTFTKGTLKPACTRHDEQTPARPQPSSSDAGSKECPTKLV